MTDRVDNSKKIKSFGKSFIFLFLVILLVFNWRVVSPLFYYFDWHVVEAKISGWLPNMSEIEKNFFASFRQKQKQALLVIPKIGVKAPSIFIEEESRGEIERFLKKGVVHYPGSVLPGEKGKMIVLGHSAPAGWPKINFDWVFSKIYALEKGDKIIIDYQGSRYVYRVVGQKVFSPEEQERFLSGSNASNDGKALLVLATCWPPGKNLKRLIVLAELDKPY